MEKNNHKKKIMHSSTKFVEQKMILEIFEKLKMYAVVTNKTQNFSMSKFINFQSNDKKKNFSVNHQYYLYTKLFKWFKYYYLKKPINLLFSLDEFLFELSKKKSRKKRPSEFQKQLHEQKKLSLFYGTLSKKELKKLIEDTKKYQGYFYKNFFSVLEKRLDVALYRIGFAKTISYARQQIKQQKILVNQHIITVPSYNLKPGDCISVDLSSMDAVRQNICCCLKTSIKKRQYFNKDSTFRFLKRKFSILQISQKSFKIVKSAIFLLFKKINKRAEIKIKTTNLLLLKYKPYISNGGKSLLFSLKKKNYICGSRTPLLWNSKNLFFYKRNKKIKKYNIQEYSIQKFVQNKLQIKQTTSQNSINMVFNLLNSNHKFIHFLIPEFKKYFLKKRFVVYNVKSYNTGKYKPLNFETCYKLLKTIVLYTPQRIKFPFFLNIDYISRIFK